jgi:hypothetical protein
MSLRDTILSAQDLKLVPVEVPEWKCTIYLKDMSGVERLTYEQSVYDKSGQVSNLDSFYTKLLVKCIVDENYKRVFSDEEIPELSVKSARVLHRLWEQAMQINKLGDDNVEDAKKNLSPAPSGDSVSV